MTGETVPSRERARAAGRRNRCHPRAGAVQCRHGRPSEVPVRRTGIPGARRRADPGSVQASRRRDEATHRRSRRREAGRGEQQGRTDPGEPRRPDQRRRGVLRTDRHPPGHRRPQGDHPPRAAAGDQLRVHPPQGVCRPSAARRRGVRQQRAGPDADVPPLQREHLQRPHGGGLQPHRRRRGGGRLRLRPRQPQGQLSHSRGDKDLRARRRPVAGSLRALPGRLGGHLHRGAVPRRRPVGQRPRAR